MQTFKILKQDTVLLSQPILIQHFGRSGAQFLSQLHYWLEKEGAFGYEYEGIRWIYNSAEAWASQLHLSVRQIRRLIAKFLSLGIVRVQKLNPCKTIRTNYYSIDYKNLEATIVQRLSSSCIEYQDILSSSLCHHDRMYIETKIKTKENNQSELSTKELTKQTVFSSRQQINQVKPVQTSCLKRKKEAEIENKKINKNESLQYTKTLPPKSPIAQNMLRIWNQILDNKAPATMSKDLAPLLVSAFLTKFERNLEQWQRYCSLITTSDYLMKKEFNLSIFWALKFSTIDRLRTGNLGVKPASLNLNLAVVDEQNIEESIRTLNESEATKALRRVIAQAIGAANYWSWFHHATFLEKGGKILLIAPNAFVESKWEELFPWINKENGI